MRRITFISLTLLISWTFSLAQQVGINIPDPLFDLDIRSMSVDTFAQINLANTDNTRFLRLRSGDNNPLSAPSIFWKDGDSLRVGTDLSGFTEILRLRSNGTMFLNSALGIRLNAADMPMITRAWDPFTSGSYAGIGRWGLFMEQNFLTIGVPNISNRGVQFVKYNPNGTIASIMMRIQDGNLGLGKDNPQFRIDAEAPLAAIRLVSTNSTVGAVLELRSTMNTGNTHPIGSINFNNPADQTPGQIAYTHEGAMVFRAGGFERLRIRHATGFLGVNNDDPMYSLDVGGDINLTGRLMLGAWFGVAGHVLTSTGDGPPQWQPLPGEKVGFAATLDSTTSIPLGSMTTLAPFTEATGFDDGNSFDAASGIFTAPSSGLYYLECKIHWQSNSTYNDIPVIVRFLLNGNIVIFGQHVSKVSVSSAYGEDQHFATLLKLNPGDQISLSVLQDGPASLNVTGNGGTSDTFFSGYKVY